MEFSQITDGLYIGTTPAQDDFGLLREIGIQLVINMRWEARPHKDIHTAPIESLWLPTYDFPLLPIPIPKLAQGTRAALETLERGGRVYIHCREGRHRSVAMGCAILIAQGMSASDAMALVKKRRANADPDLWYIRQRIAKFEMEWNRKRPASH